MFSVEWEVSAGPEETQSCLLMSSKINYKDDNSYNINTTKSWYFFCAYYVSDTLYV